MNLESQICSLELAKRLKELHVKQESLFFHINVIGDWNITANITEKDKMYLNHLTYDIFPLTDIYSAFTVSELFTLLPHRITLKEGEPFNSFRLRVEKGIWCLENKDVGFENIKYSNFYSVNYYCDTTDQTLEWQFNALMKNITDENCANALAKMLAHLIEKEMV